MSKNYILVAVETLDALLKLLLLLNFFGGGGVHEVELFHSGLNIYIITFESIKTNCSFRNALTIPAKSKSATTKPL